MIIIIIIIIIIIKLCDFMINTKTYKVQSQVRMIHVDSIIHNSHKYTFSGIPGLPCVLHIHRNRCVFL